MILGMVLALSSTAVVIQLLKQRRELGTRWAWRVRHSAAAGSCRGWPMIILVTCSEATRRGVFSGGGAGGGQGSGRDRLDLYSRRRAIRPLFHHTSERGGQSDRYVLLRLHLAREHGYALTSVADCRCRWAAFPAGAVGRTEYRHEVEITIEPFKGC